MSEARPAGAPRSLFSHRSFEIESKKLAVWAATLADQKKAQNIAVLDVSEHLKVVDWFVLLTCTSRPHVKAVSQEIHVRLKEGGEVHRPQEGDDLRWWTLLDYGDVVVHVLQQDAREYYDLDRLYKECPRLDWAAESLPPGLPGLEGEAASGVSGAVAKNREEQ